MTLEQKFIVESLIDTLKVLDEISLDTLKM